MRKDKLCNKIIEENYAAILRLCIAKLVNDDYGAEECTQEVFELFLRKQDELDLNDRIDRWLIAAASRIVKKYIREKAERLSKESETLDSISTKEDESFSDGHVSVFDALTDEEYSLLQRYYSLDDDRRSELASELGIPLNNLYQRIYAIKRKLKPPK